MSQQRQIKQSLRQSMRERLRALSSQERYQAGKSAAIHLETYLAAYPIKTVAMTRSFGYELPTEPMAEVIRGRGGRIGWIPADRETDPTSFDLTDDYGAILHNCRPWEVDLILVPGLAFTTFGSRLGQGGGFFDRYLVRRRRGCLAIGVAFGIQILDELPEGPHDARLDGIIVA